MKTKKGSMPALSNLLARHGSLVALLLMMVIASIIYPEFRTMRNITNVFRQMSMVGLSAVGMTFVIISGGIDLSIGSTIALSGILLAKLSGSSVLLAIVVPLLVGAVIGLVNAFIITRLRVVPFIATLGIAIDYGLHLRHCVLRGNFYGHIRRIGISPAQNLTLSGRQIRGKQAVLRIVFDTEDGFQHCQFFVFSHHRHLLSCLIRQTA